MRGWTRLIRDEAGAELAEFAISMMIFTLMLFAVIEFSQAVYAANLVNMDAEMGARYAMVRGSDWTTACATTTSVACYTSVTGVQNYILTLPHPGGGFTASNITVTPMTTNVDSAACTAWARGCRIEVNVSYTFKINLPILPSGFAPLSPTLSSTSIETIQD